MPLRSASGSGIDMPVKPVAPFVLGKSAAARAEVRQTDLDCFYENLCCAHTAAFVAGAFCIGYSCVL